MASRLNGDNLTRKNGTTYNVFNQHSKIEKLKALINRKGASTIIEIDGGVKVDNIREIKAAGADTFVAGSAIFSQPDYKKVIDEMRAELAKAV
jgi:ribulose-phosphate 3-epimerase